MRRSWISRGAVLSALVVGALMLSTGPAGGPDGGPARSPNLALADGDQGWTDKVEGRLRTLSEQARGGSASVQSDAAARGVASIANRLRVVVEAAGGNRAAAGVAIRDVGGQIELEYADLIQALVPADRIPDLAADRRVRYVRTPFEPVARAIAGEGVGASGAAAWQAAGINGTGVKVAVIDGGFKGLQDRKNNGDIPPAATVVDLCNGGVESTSHGTGVAEVVAEMAPGAQLLLFCVGGDVSLGQAKDQAKAAGANIITMSLAYINTSRGDGSGGPGSPDAVVTDARQSGIFWVNSAGNASAGEFWYGPWVDANNDGYLDFSPTRNANQVTIGAGAQVCVYLNWDSWPTTSQDFALELHNPANFAGPLLVPAADTLQDGSQPPTEISCFTNNNPSPQAYDVAIKRVNATAPFPTRFQLQAVNQRFEFFKTDSDIDIPASSPNAFAVGAVCWQSDRLEDYSSRGPTIDGRIKPDIAAQTDVSSGTGGAWQACPPDSDGIGGFNGTSAAAPHAAGAAALVKQAFPSFSPADIQSFLASRSRDAGPPGADNGFGVGILTLGAAPAPGSTPPSTATPTATPTATVIGGPGSTPTPTATPTLTATVPPGSTATATPTATRPPATGPAVSLNVTRNGTNSLLVVVTARTGDTLQGISWTLPANATAETTAGIALPTGVTLPAGTTSTSFVLRRTSGATVTLPILVRGSFGQWPTLVGGGTNAWGP